MPIKSPPDWPGIMRRETAAMYCDMTPAQFIREVNGNRLPQPFVLGGREMWSRMAIDETVRDLAGDNVPNWRASSPLYNPDLSRAELSDRKRRSKDPATATIRDEAGDA